MADSIGLNLNVIDINNPSINELSEILSMYDGPSNTLAFYPIAKLYKEIKRKGITVSLDGQGPDEMLAGYWPVKEAMQAAFNAKNFKWFADIYSTYVSRTNRAYFDKNAIKKIAHEVIWKDFAKRKLRGEPGFVDNGWVKSDIQLPNGINALENKLHEQFFQNPLPGILNQYDRCSMISGVECRMPYMDYRVVEYLFSIPSTDKIQKGYTKYILRMAAENLVPDDIRLEKVKYGFNAPILDWFNQGLGDWMGEIFNSKSFEEFPYFDGKKVKDDFNAFRLSKNQNWQQAWNFWSPFHIYWWHNHAKSLMK
jgi:asparagine synthase (glutamine-hydrolysing)